ncbi:hypothetical protein C0J52_08141 [Blattella germanica]|nr:hypothetical protein C0J52_08141 [Blattella germanica]
MTTKMGKGNGISESEFSDGEDASNSAEEMLQQDEGEEVLDRVGGMQSYKRPFEVGQSEVDQSQAKKRRKQSKPVKLFSLTDPSDKDSDDEQDLNNEGKKKHDIAIPPQGDESFKTISLSHANQELDPYTESETRVSIGPVTDRESQCPYCPDTLNSKERLKFHIENGHVQKLFQNQLQQKIRFDAIISGKSEIPLNLSHLPAADSTSPLDNVVGSSLAEFRNQNDESSQGTKLPEVLSQAHDPGSSGTFIDGKMPFPGYIPLSPHFLLPLISQGSSHNSSPSATQSQTTVPGTTPIRIFNPDAYCELCNKEFCNKYFLKTHKANKHGIYVDSPSNNFPGSPYNFVQTNLNLSHIPSLATNTPTVKPMSVVPKIPETLFANKIAGNGQMKAFCDICQKKFCNKYFVRRHKAKIHGIFEECLTPSGNSTLFNLSDCIQKQDPDEPGSVSAGSDTGSNVIETVSSDMPANMLEVEELRINLHEKQSNSLQIKLSPNNSCVDEISEGSHVKEEPEPDLDEGRSTEDFLETNSILSTKHSPTQSQHAYKNFPISTDKLRKLGVINADAFCEICCKEYCNKYFLRTHKMKRHGIYISDSDSKDGKPSGSNNIQWNHNQTSPLNLIVGEQGTNSSDSIEKNRNDFTDEDHECEVCGRRFQSFYLMQMHRLYVHLTRNEKTEPVASDTNGTDEQTSEGTNRDYVDKNLSNAREVAATELQSINNNNDGNANGGKDAISDDLQKLQTMILQLNNLNVGKLTTCTICSKESENHYCLRAHMMTEHGILVEDQTEAPAEKIPALELSAMPPLIDTQTYCFACKKDFLTHFQLKQHIDEMHMYTVTHSATPTSSGGNAIKEEFESKSPSEKPQNQNVSSLGSEKRISLTPTSSYCEICNKELCNKYFMKTHMQRMHGIEIENGAQIGGVICDICNKELCSKYFLRVHKQNTHGIVEDGSASQSTRDTGNGSNVQNTIDTDQALKPSELSDLSNRYYSHFTEVCSICNRRFRSTKWLKAHLLNDHGENGIDKLKKLESKYQVISQGKQHLQAMRNATIMNNNSSSGPSYSPTLKIPNNWKNQEQGNGCPQPSTLITTDRSNHSGGQIFPHIFGSGDANVKNYHCSYCPFTTPVLAFLFVHERSHSGLASQTLPDPSKPFQCPVCLQSFLQGDVLQHHILTHQFSGMLSPFFGPSSSGQYPQNVSNLQVKDAESPNSGNGDHAKNENNVECEVIEEDSVISTEERFRFRCSKCSQRFKSREICASHIQNRHSNAVEATSSSLKVIPIKVTAHGLYKCARCGFSSVHMVIVKKHIRKEHKAECCQMEMRQEPQREDSFRKIKEPTFDEVKDKLQEAARKCQVPASYAVPQNQGPSPDQFIMQPFLLEEPDGTPSSEQLHLDRKFVPSLVFLPVKEKLSEPLTVSFTLTPA